MTDTYSFTVAGEPVAKARPRVVNGHTYTPSKTKDAEEAIGWAFKAKYPGITADSESSFSVDIEFIISNYKNGKPRKFDLDNGVKTVLDALNGVVWGDDNQVTSVKASKNSSVERSGTQISIMRVR